MPVLPIELCQKCSTAIPEGTDVCPGCGAQLVFCFNGDCCRAYTADKPECPYCKTPNEMADQFGPPSPVPVEARPAPLDAARGAERRPDSGPASAPRSPAPRPPTAAAPTRVAETAPNPPMPPVAPLLPANLPPELLAALPALLSGEPAGSFAPAPVSAAPVPISASAAPLMPVPATQSRWGAAVMPTAAPAEVQIPLDYDNGPLASDALMVQIDTGRPKRHEQGLVRIRLNGRAMRTEATVDVTVESGCWEGPAAMKARLAPGQIHELPAVRFTPRISGTDEVRIMLTLTTAADVPLGRWTGAETFEIAEAVHDPVANVRAGGDVIVVGGLTTSPAPNTGQAFRTASWHDVELRADNAFANRLARLCPRPSLAAPSLPDEWTSPFQSSFQGLINLTDHQARRRHVIVASVGETAAALGRGGNDAVAWWIKPLRFDEQQYRRLSGNHFLIELRDGRAWLTDNSTNGTWLEGERIARAEPHLLADGDRVEPARVLRLTAALEASADADEIRAVWLLREDAVYNGLSYLLVRDGAPVHPPPAARHLPPLWLAWVAPTPTDQRGDAAANDTHPGDSPDIPGRHPHLAVWGGNTWITIAAGAETNVGRFGVRWEAPDRPVGQDTYYP